MDGRPHLVLAAMYALCLASHYTKRSPQVGCDLLDLLGREVVASLVRWLAILELCTILFGCYIKGFYSFVDGEPRCMEALSDVLARQVSLWRNAKEPCFTRLVLDLPLIGGRVVAI